MTTEGMVSEMCEYADGIANPMISDRIKEYGDLILAAVEAERKEWQKERLTWERRVKMAASVAKAKGGKVVEAGK